MVVTYIMWLVKYSKTENFHEIFQFKVAVRFFREIRVEKRLPYALNVASQERYVYIELHITAQPGPVN